MTDFGTISKIIPAQNVKIYRGSDEVTLTTDVKFSGTRVRTDTMTRAGPIYTFQWRSREIEFTAVLTKDIASQIETDAALDGRSALDYNSWKIEGLNIGGSTSDDVDDTYSAGVQGYEELAPESGPATIRIKLIIAGDAS